MNRGEQPASPNRSCRPQNGSVAAGVFLLVLSVYVLANPGRIDIIDGQIRYEVTMNWLLSGRPVVRDPVVVSCGGVPGKKGFAYSYYGPLASVAAMPLVWAGTFYDDPPGEASRFLFSLTTSVFGALAVAILFLFYIELQVEVKKALAWTGVAAFATLVWPASETTNDNAQHACLVLAAVFLGFVSAERRSPPFAVLGGLVAGLLFTYQEYFALIIPILAFSTMNWSSWGDGGRTGGVGVLFRSLRQLVKFDGAAALREFKSPAGLSPQEVQAFRDARRRFGLFLVATVVGVAFALYYNFQRFGSLFDVGKTHPQNSGTPLFGNPLAGLLTLLISPGKSIVLYSPAIILGFAGIQRLRQHRPQVGFVIVATSMILILFLSTIAFAGGAWCWGPRYLVPIVPLWALAFPFVPFNRGHGRRLVLATVVAGLIVQLLGVSVENQRFFFERGLRDFYWANNPWFEFKHSQLIARPSELLSLIKGPPREAVMFNTVDYPPTYTALRPLRAVPSQAPYWMRHYRLFYVPRPWPIWMWDIPPDQRALNLTAWLAGIFGVALLGLALLQRGLHYEF